MRILVFIFALFFLSLSLYRHPTFVIPFSLSLPSSVFVIGAPICFDVSVKFFPICILCVPLLGHLNFIVNDLREKKLSTNFATFTFSLSYPLSVSNGHLANSAAALQ